MFTLVKSVTISILMEMIVYNASSIFISNDYEGKVVLDGEESADAVFFKKVDIPSLEEVNPPDRIVIKDIIEKLNIEKYI
ncbi:hypothetical protein [Clostridium perfringens str. 13]|uniref:Uncharacterized protein n=2 Tax=Clostridium perfringens TaxID=1502 RepID=Q8XH65_CLOPE|nr:hypothetical protein [Clostridium perfringens str. 13]